MTFFTRTISIQKSSTHTTLSGSELSSRVVMKLFTLKLKRSTVQVLDKLISKVFELLKSVLAGDVFAAIKCFDLGEAIDFAFEKAHDNLMDKAVNYLVKEITTLRKLNIPSLKEFNQFTSSKDPEREFYFYKDNQHMNKYHYQFLLRDLMDFQIIDCKKAKTPFKFSWVSELFHSISHFGLVLRLKKKKKKDFPVRQEMKMSTVMPQMSLNDMIGLIKPSPSAEPEIYITIDWYPGKQENSHDSYPDVVKLKFTTPQFYCFGPSDAVSFASVAVQHQACFKSLLEILQPTNDRNCQDYCERLLDYISKGEVRRYQDL